MRKLAGEGAAGRTVTTGDRLLRESPLYVVHQELGAQFVSMAGWYVPWVYTSPQDEIAVVQKGVGLADLSQLGKVSVRGDAARGLLAAFYALEATAPGQASQVSVRDEIDRPLSGSHLAGLTADEFLVITPPGNDEEATCYLDQHLRAGDLFVSVVNQTAGLAGLLVAGPDSREVLSKLCELPFGPGDFPNQRVAQTGLARVRIIVVRNDLAGLPAFELYFERPYAEYLWTSVLEAGREFGLLPFGWRARELL
jgi:heterotetrameric sarcosine oxidase gamma subunit